MTFKRVLHYGRSIVTVHLHLDEVVATADGAELGRGLVSSLGNQVLVELVTGPDELPLADLRL